MKQLGALLLPLDVLLVPQEGELLYQKDGDTRQNP